MTSIICTHCGQQKYLPRGGCKCPSSKDIEIESLNAQLAEKETYYKQNLDEARKDYAEMTEKWMDAEEQLALTRKALELACTRDHFDGEKWILHELDLIKMQGHLNHAMNLLSQAQSGGGK